MTPVINRFHINVASLFNDNNTNDVINRLTLNGFILCIKPKIDHNHTFQRPINYNELFITVEQTFFGYSKRICL